MSRSKRQHGEVARLIGQADVSLLDLVDNVINRGVVVSGDVMLGVADVDLIYLRLSVLLCAADRVLPPEELEP
ncbi:MAG TPA: gas vesicle protein [Polyangia bacterium]|nr:gas vesicle protein [Polyangia bacterium]